MSLNSAFDVEGIEQCERCGEWVNHLNAVETFVTTGRSGPSVSASKYLGGKLGRPKSGRVTVNSGRVYQKKTTIHICDKCQEEESARLFSWIVPALWVFSALWLWSLCAHYFR